MTDPRKNTEAEIGMLVPVAERDMDGASVPTVNARELHAFLEVKRDFSTWIKDRIEKYGFVEGADYVRFEDLTSPNPGRSKSRARVAIGYALSLDMAKELSMVENNEKGRQARRYFIAMEKRAKAAPAPEIDMKRIRENRLQFNGFMKLAKMMGFEGNQAVLSANTATARVIGFDALAAMGVTHMNAPEPEALLTPTDIAARLGLSSARAANKLLTDFGFQAAFRDAKGALQYEPTRKGKKAGATMQDTGRRHASGTPVRQLKWASGVVGLLGGEMEAGA